MVDRNTKEVFNTMDEGDKGMIDSNFVTAVLQQIKQGIDEYNELRYDEYVLACERSRNGESLGNPTFPKRAQLPKEVEIEHNGVKFVVPFK